MAIQERAKDRQKKGLKSGEKSYDIILTLPRNAEGKRKQKWIPFHGTKKQVRAREAELKAELNRGEFIEATKLTLGAWLDEWLDKAIRPPRCTINIYRTYTAAINKHIKPALGDHLLQRLTPMQVERYYADCGLAPRTIALHHAILSGALGAAVDSSLLRSSISKRIKNRPRVTPSADVLHNVWTADEAQKFLTAVKQDDNAQCAALFALALDTGARKAELLALKWSDLNGSTLRIERQLIREDSAKPPSTPTFSMPKGKRARQLDLSQDTLDLLKTHKSKQAELKLRNRQHYADLGLMFAQEWEHQNGPNAKLGNPLNMMSMNGYLSRLCKVANVKRITIHGLRHTSATLMLSAGVPTHVVQQRLGHTNSSMTLDIYSHVLPSMQTDAASKLAKLLHG